MNADDRSFQESLANCVECLLQMSDKIGGEGFELLVRRAERPPGYIIDLRIQGTLKSWAEVCHMSVGGIPREVVLDHEVPGIVQRANVGLRRAVEGRHPKPDLRTVDD